MAAGIQHASLGANAATEDYFASAYLTGPVFGAQKDTLLNGEQPAFIGRLAARPYHDEDWNLHAGFSGQTVFHPNINASGTPGVSQTTLTLGDQPELRIDFNKLVDTGPLSARGASVYGGELGANKAGEVARLRLPSGQELRAPHDDSCVAGRGMLFIRPERVEIAPGMATSGDPRVNALAGSVRRCSFLGNILRYAVDLEGTAPITVDLQNTAGVVPLPVGAPVVLRWPVSDSLILPGEA